MRGARTAFAVMGFALALSAVSAPLYADDTMPPAAYADQQLADPAKEAAAQALMETLRCLVCQSQSIAESNAPIAGDMRSVVRTRIANGEAPAAIRAWMVARYGAYVTYAPPLTGATWPLFAAPLVLLAVVALALRRRFGGAVRT